MCKDSQLELKVVKDPMMKDFVKVCVELETASRSLRWNFF